MKTTQFGSYLTQVTRFPGFFPINAYLVREDDGFTLIDTGMPGGSKDYIQIAAGLGLPIKRITLTHAHGDHAGSIDELHAALPEAEIILTARQNRLLHGDLSLDPTEPQSKLRGMWVPRQVQPTRVLAVGERIGSLQTVAALQATRPTTLPFWTHATTAWSGAMPFRLRLARPSQASCGSASHSRPWPRGTNQLHCKVPKPCAHSNPAGWPWGMAVCSKRHWRRWTPRLPRLRIKHMARVSATTHSERGVARSTPRTRIDRSAVIEAAAMLADQYGSIDQVTLAQVAEHFQIRVPSLYNHIDGLDGLRREIALLSVQALTAHIRQAAVGKAGNDAVVAVAHAYRRFAQQYPGRYLATQRAADAEDEALIHASQELIDLLLLVLEPFALEMDDALHVIRALRSITHGFVMLEVTGGFGMNLDRDESYRRLVQMFVDGLQSQRRGSGTR